jgi:hypothetical protein
VISFDSVTDLTMFSRSMGVMCFLELSDVLKEAKREARSFDWGVAMLLSREDLVPNEEARSGIL